MKKYPFSRSLVGIALLAYSLQVPSRLKNNIKTGA